MDWRSVTFDWNRARAFLVTAEEGSYSAAARALGLTQPTVGRQIAALEEELGVALFERVGHGLEPTEAALELLEHARTMGRAANALSLAAAGQSSAIDGSVRITASQLISSYLLGPLVARVRRDHPGIRLELVATNAVQDLRRREADIAVRNAPPAHDDLIGRRLEDAVARPYARRGSLGAPGEPLTAETLARADFLGFEDVGRMVQGLNALGYPVTAANFPIVTDDHLVQWNLARQGLGICIVMEQVGDADPDMERVLPDLPGIPVQMWLVTHRELRTSRRIRLVFDALAEALTGPVSR